jgi:hypothetical protein
VDFQITLNGFPLATQVTGAQIHQGSAGTVGAVTVDTGIGGGVTLVTGSGSISRTGIDVDGDVVDALNTNASGFYFNVSTSANTAGALRGQLKKE